MESARAARLGSRRRSETRRAFDRAPARRLGLGGALALAALLPLSLAGVASRRAPRRPGTPAPRSPPRPPARWPEAWTPASPTPAASRRTAPSPAGASTARAGRLAPAGTFTAVSAGDSHTCGDQDRRRPRLLGRQQLRPGDPARGHLHRGERRRRPQLRVRTNGTLACWGLNGYGQATPPAGTFTAVSAGDLPHLRREDQRHPRLLGLQHDGQATPPAGTFTAVSAGG